MSRNCLSINRLRPFTRVGVDFPLQAVQFIARHAIVLHVPHRWKVAGMNETDKETVGPKSLTKSIRFSTEQWARIEEASRQESERRGERIDPTALFREVGMPGIEAILAAA